MEEKKEEEDDDDDDGSQSRGQGDGDIEDVGCGDEAGGWECLVQVEA